MTNCEHLIENALVSMEKARINGSDVYEVFKSEMNKQHNKMMLSEVSMTQKELWEIAQYIIYTDFIKM